MGALNSFEGEGGVIASSQNYSENVDLKDKVWDFDKNFKQVFDNYTQTDNFEQIFCFPNNINNTEYYFAIKAKKHYTKFPERNRFYDRREYFFFDFEDQYDRIDFAKSLPDIKDYNKRANGTEVFQKKEIEDYSPNTEISKALLLALLNNDTIKIKFRSDAQDLILNAISAFPDCYKRYLGFGFNVKDDSFTNANLHIFSTFDDGAIDIDDLKLSGSKQWNDCVEYLSDKEKNKYDDTEISKSEINHNTIYKLLDYHKLHYQIDNEVIETQEDLQAKAVSYILKFVKNENAKNDYIKERVTAIIKFWCEQKIMDYDLYQQIKKHLAEQKFEFPKNTEIQEYIKKLVDEHIPNGNDEIWKKLNEEDNSDDNTKKMLTQLGFLSYIFGKDGLGEFLNKNIVLTTIAKLLKKENLETQLKWKEKYSKFDNNILPIVLFETNNLDEFISSCNTLIKYKSDEYKDEVQRYIEIFKGNNVYDFYEKALETAKEYAFQISLQESDFTDGNLLDFYTLFNNNETQIQDTDVVLYRIAEKIINDLYDIAQVLEFSQKNEKFVEKYKELFIKRIAELYNDSYNSDKYECLKLLFKDIIKNKRNLFIEKENPFSEITELTKEQCDEVYKFGKSIEKLKDENKDIIINLIDKIINNNMEKVKMKNIIATSTKKMRNIAICAIIVCSLLIASNVFFGYCWHNNYVKLQAIEQTVSDIDTTSIDQQDIKGLVIDSLQNLSKLNPLPNDTLKKKKVYVKMAVQGDSITKVVNKILRINQNDIAQYYQFQKEDYQKYIIELNPDCFSVQKDTCECDTLRIIPSYKQK